MASTNLAYRYDAFAAAPERRSRRSDVRAVRTGTHVSSDAQRSRNELLVTAAKAAAVLFVFVAALCFARIALTNAAVTTLIESDEISAQISAARSSGVGLEMEQSVLSSNSALNAAMKRLHMAAPAEVGTLALEPDVVAVDANGVLSLSDTVKNVVGMRG